MADEEYLPVWQTWDMLSGVPVAPCEAPTLCASSEEDVRRDIQRARVDKRLSIPVLAAQVGLDPTTLASFESGEEVLPHDTVRRVQLALGIVRPPRKK